MNDAAGLHQEVEAEDSAKAIAVARVADLDLGIRIENLSSISSSGFEVCTK
jgi:hypothetical protein